jgi:hypothetical protein
MAWKGIVLPAVAYAQKGIVLPAVAYAQKGIVLPAVAYAQSKPMTIWAGAASRDPSASSPRPLTTQANPARRALLA